MKDDWIQRYRGCQVISEFLVNFNTNVIIFGDYADNSVKNLNPRQI